MSDTDPDARPPRLQDRQARSSNARRRVPSAVHEVCPFLRADHGSWRSAYASREHRCTAVRPPAVLAVAKQRSLCLMPEHVTCATYVAARALVAESVPTSARDDGADLWPETRSTPVLLEPTRGLLPPLSASPTRAGGQVLLVALMAMAFVVLVISRTAPQTAGGPTPGPSSSLAAVAPSVTSSPSAGPTVTPASSPSPTPSAPATPSPSPAVTRAPSPTPLPGDARRYTVQAGDTLSGIAAKFKTTVKAIAAANNITNTRLIHAGQVLIIP